MLTEKVGTRSTWDQFMQVKAQAQQRNSGLIKKPVVKASVTRTAEVLKSSGMVSAQPATGLHIAKSTMYRSSSNVEQGKILGGSFDAWA